MNPALEEVVAEVAAAPQSAAALTLYALVSTLELERAGCLFKLAKLRDLTVAQRRVAYRLIEMMAQRQNQGADWQIAKARMDRLVRGS